MDEWRSRDLGRDLGEPDPNGTDLVAEDLSAVQSFPGRDGVVEPLKVDKLGESGPAVRDASQTIRERAKTYSARFVRQDSGTLDRTERREDGKQMVRSRGRRNRANPQGSGRLSLQVQLWSVRLSTGRPRMYKTGRVRGGRRLGCTARHSAWLAALVSCGSHRPLP